MNRTLLAAALLTCLMAADVLAQWDSLTPSPSAVRFRRFWIMGGNDTTTIGYGAGALGDVNRDGFADFCVTRHRRKGNRLDMESMIFYGNADSTKLVPTQTIPGRPLARGDFWGTGKEALVFMSQRMFLFGSSDVVRVHRTDADSIESASSSTFDTGIDSVAIYVLHISGAAADDMDADGYDDLILVFNYSQREGQLDHTAEFWIYRGGPDFSLAQPTRVLRDTVEQSGGNAPAVAAADLDGDALPELVVQTMHIDPQSHASYSRLSFWWGRSEMTAFPVNPDYSVGAEQSFLFAADFDGDSRADLLGSRGRVFLSSSGKHARSRSWSTSDHEVRISLMAYSSVLGPMNDSTGRFSMVATDEFVSNGSWDRLVGLSGSPSGPDLKYEASWFPAEEGAPSGILSTVYPLGDVNGDHWDDALYANFQWGTYDMGVAAILLGGRYIPRDFEFAAAEQTEGVEAATGTLKPWPNPARSNINLTWSGAPSAQSIDVVDLLGRTIAHVAVAPGTTSVGHDCSGLPAGAYFAILRDGLSRPLCMTPLQIH